MEYHIINHTIRSAVMASGMSRSFLYEQLKIGRLKAKKCGRRTLIADTDLRDFLGTLPDYNSEVSAA